jgi:hypothetical protein
MFLERSPNLQKLSLKQYGEAHKVSYSLITLSYFIAIILI